MNTPTKTLLVLGATSDIGRAVALAFAHQGWFIQMAGRPLQAVQREATDIALRTGLPVTAHEFDVLQTCSFTAFIDALPSLPDAVVSVIGLLGEQHRAEVDLSHATLIMRSNYEGPSLILGLFAERFAARGSGTIAGVSSVAGDRGRASNYVYGSAKAGFTAFLSGLRARCARRGVHVVTIKPGFLRTRMTEKLKLPAALTTSAEHAAIQISSAIVRQKDVVYIGRRWRLIMGVICGLPEYFFKRLQL